MDATSLYTVIPIDEGLWALKHFSDQRTVKELRPNQYLHSVTFHSVATTTIKLMAQPWVLKWDSATPIFS